MYGCDLERRGWNGLNRMTDNANRPDCEPGLVHIERLLQTIAERDAVVRAFCEVQREPAVATAKELDALPASERKPLHGLGIAIKEVFDVAGGLCAWGSEIHAGRRPDQDAAIVKALRDAGAVILGTTASTEYAMARTAPTTNPHDSARTPGASSSGSAAAIAAEMADIAIGSQTIGSGIRPAAYCGVFGFKPTQGRFSLEGAMPLADILDHPVIFAATPQRISTAFRALCVSDAALVDGAAGSRQSQPRTRTKIALVLPWFDEPHDARVWDAVKTFANKIAGADCTDVTLPASLTSREEACLTTILSADMWRHHAADYRQHPEKTSDKLQAWLVRGRDIKPEDYKAALELRASLIEEALQALEPYDFFVTLATTNVAPLLSEGTGSRAPQRLWNLLGWPAMAAPIGTIDGLPTAVQIIGRKGSDEALLEFTCSLFPDSGTQR